MGKCQCATFEFGNSVTRVALLVAKLMQKVVKTLDRVRVKGRRLPREGLCFRACKPWFGKL